MILFIIVNVLILFIHSGNGQVTSSEGRSFAVAFSAVRSDVTDGWCKLYVNSKGSTDINVTTDSGSTTYSVDGTSEDVLAIDMQTSLRTLSGTENKAVFVEAASSDITVTLSNYRATDQIGETLLVMPLAPPGSDSPSMEYHVLSYPSSNTVIQCRPDSTLSFYSIIATADTTTVTIFEPRLGGGYTERDAFELNRGEVYTERVTRDGSNNDDDITGFKIIADKSVSVTGGNSCVDLRTGTNPGEGQIWATMPSTAQAGSQYISHPIKNDIGNHPYMLRVLAIQDNTQVSFRDSRNATSLDSGEFLSHELSDAFEEDVISCSNPCLVAEYALDDQSAIFMTVLPPTTHYSNSIKFTHPATEDETSTGLDQYINIIITGEPASSGITLDGTDISGLTWTQAVDYSYITLVEDGGVEKVHTLESDVGFSVLVHAQMSSDSGRGGEGHGSAAAVGVVDENTPPTTPPPVDGKQPLYRISMSGEFITSAVLDGLCASTYSAQFNTRALGMIGQANDLIGSATMCNGKSIDDMSLISVSSVFAPNRASADGITFLGYIVLVNMDTMTVEEVSSCGSDIGNYLLAHSNWPDADPLPDVSDCPTLTFLSDFFNSTGDEFICPVTTNVEGYAIPHYTMGHSGVFETTDGSDISLECLIDYTFSFETSTRDQVTLTNDMLASNALCSAGKVGNVTIESASSSATAVADEGSTFQNYVFESTTDVTTEYLYSCVDEISQFLIPHDNWEGTIISAPGCPDVVFPSNMFNEESKRWRC